MLEVQKRGWIFNRVGFPKNRRRKRRGREQRHVGILQLSTPLHYSCREGSDTLLNIARGGDEALRAVDFNWLISDWKHARVPCNPQPSSQPQHPRGLTVTLVVASWIRRHSISAVIRTSRDRRSGNIQLIPAHR